MPTMLTWEFTGDETGSEIAERRGTQRVYSSGMIVDKILGTGVVDRIDGSWKWIEIGSCDDKVVHEAQCMGVRTDLTAPEIDVRKAFLTPPEIGVTR